MLPFRPSENEGETGIIKKQLKVSAPLGSSPTTLTGGSNVPRPPRPRTWELRIDPEKEVITNFSILANFDHKNPRPTWVETPRVLLSHRLSRSYIYADFLHCIGHTCNPMLVWKAATHLGSFEPISMVPLYVATNGLEAEPFLVEFCVLRGSPPPGGVDLMLGCPHIHPEVHRQYWTTPPPAPPSGMPSSGGKSLLYPTEAQESKGASRKATDCPDLLTHDEYHPDIPYRPRGLAPPLLAREQDGSGTLPTIPWDPPFPWKSAFSWGSGQLLLDGKALPTANLTGGISENSGAIDGGSFAASTTEYTAQDSVLSLGIISSETLSSAVSNEGQIARIIAERRELLANLLEEHYWRTHPPQRSGKQNGSQGRHSGIAANSRPSNANTTSSPSLRQRPPKKSKGIDNGSGSGDDDDEEDGGSNGTPPRARVSGPTEYFACPFLKWKPQQYYSTCGCRYRTVSHMIHHLQHMHYAKHCARCHLAFESAKQKEDHIREGCTETHGRLSRPGVISEEQWNRISERPKGKKRHESSDQEKRWYLIFKILFPQSPPPNSAYIIEKVDELVGGLKNELMDGLKAYVKREGLQELERLQDEFARKDVDGKWYEPRDQQTWAVLKLLIPRLMDQLVTGYMSEGASGSGASQDITMVNGEHIGGMTASPDQCVGSSNTLISNHHAGQPAMLTTCPPSMQSPCLYGKLPELTNPTTTGLDKSISCNEIMNNTGQSGRDEDCLDLFLNDNIGSDKWAELSETGMELSGLGAWNETLGAAPLLAGGHIPSSENKSNWELSPMTLGIDNDDNQILPARLDFPIRIPPCDRNAKSLYRKVGGLSMGDATLAREFAGSRWSPPRLTGAGIYQTGLHNQIPTYPRGSVSSDVTGCLGLLLPQLMGDDDPFQGLGK